MNTFIKTVALLLLALWLPATSHCSLDMVWTGLACHDAAPPAVDESNCCEDACEMVESGAFLKTVAGLRLAPADTALPVCWLMLLSVPEARTEKVFVNGDDAPEVWHLNRTWAFVRRAALPARAPNRLA